MEERETTEPEDELLVGVGLTGGRKSKIILKWAMEKFLQEENVRFKLLHVYPKITAVPTPMGNWLPIAKVREDIVVRYRQETEWKRKKMLLPYQKILKENKVKTDIVVLESDDVAMAISLEVANLAIRHLVIGVSSVWSLSWKNLSKRTGGESLSSIISETSPSFCSVYVVAARKLEHSRPAECESNSIFLDDTSGLSSTCMDGSSSLSSVTLDRLWKSRPSSLRSPAKLASKYMEFSHTMPSVASHSSSSGDLESWDMDGEHPGGLLAGTFPQGQSSASAATLSQYQPPADSGTGSSPAQRYDLERLRSDITYTDEMYELTQNSVVNAMFLFPMSQPNDFSKQRVDEALKLEEKHESTRKEKTKIKAAQNQAIDSGQNAERNTNQETKVPQEPPDIENKLNQQHEIPVIPYQKFTLKEVLKATASFSDKCKIGTGAFGAVYKCKLHHTTVAVKILHSKDSATNKQFLKELEILSKIRHPHLLMLLGAIPEESCLVYEYMENGSLDDILFRNVNRPPLSWYDRFRICWEVAGALTFLHSTKPTHIIHRDLKPANILLDQNLVSKIGDIGLGLMMNVEPTTMSVSTLYKETTLVGTLCYIDPEYQRTGRVSTKSDIYALGIVILQLLTSKPAAGITYMVEDAINGSNLKEILDPEAGNWPEEETLELALLGLQCAELMGKDRPDLTEKILPVLERLKEGANCARESASVVSTAPPAHFICPISKGVMRDPYVAADGYTYDRTAIEQWLAEHNTSPTTNLPLTHKIVMPNHALFEAIAEWKSKYP